MDRNFVLYAQNRATGKREYMRDFYGELQPITEEEVEIFLNLDSTINNPNNVEWGFVTLEEAQQEIQSQ